MAKGVQAKDVPEAEVLALMAARHPSWTQSWDLQEAFPRFPPKVLLAKMRALKKRGLVDGCGCGCRGDWELIPEKPTDLASREVGPKEITP